MKQNFESLAQKNANVHNIINCTTKTILKHNPKLFITDDNNNELYRCDNIQTLYLYPLTVMDYIKNLTDKHVIFLNIIEIDLSLDYDKLLNHTKFYNLKAVEILIKDEYSLKELKKICEIIQILHNKKIYICLNIKNVNNIAPLVNYFKYITYFKVFLPNDLNVQLYQTFLNKLNLISKELSSGALLHIKTYLNEKQALLYKQMVNDFSHLGVSIFQVSKELIPLSGDNIKVDKKVQVIVRDLERKYSKYKYNRCKFISVKDITCLYYPRFELDERNSKKCYACYMKPYLYKDRLLPCKVNKIFSNMNSWSCNYSCVEEYDNIVNKCGTNCDDCASIFENDLLYEVESIMNNNSKVNIFLK